MPPTPKGMKMPKPGHASVEAFNRVVPAAPGVTKRPMFGNQAAFVNGNMFAGLFGDDLFVRLPEARLQEVLAAGGRPFEPMPGRAMKGYAYVPAGGDTGALVREALEFVAAMPPKKGR